MKKGLKETLAPMSTKEKISYIWHYYKIHMIISVVVIIIAVTTTMSAMNKKEPAINMMVLGEKVDYAMATTIQDQMTNEFLTEEEREKYHVLLQPILSSSDGADGAIGIQKMIAEIAGGYLHIVVAPSHLYNQVNVDNQLLDINTIVDLSSYNLNEDEMLLYDGDTLTGIRAKAIPILDKVIYDDDAIVYLPGNAKNKEYIAEFLKYLLDATAKIEE